MDLSEANVFRYQSAGTALPIWAMFSILQILVPVVRQASDVTDVILITQRHLCCDAQTM